MCLSIRTWPVCCWVVFFFVLFFWAPKCLVKTDLPPSPRRWEFKKKRKKKADDSGTRQFSHQLSRWSSQHTAVWRRGGKCFSPFTDLDLKKNTYFCPVFLLATRQSAVFSLTIWWSFDGTLHHHNLELHVIAWWNPDSAAPFCTSSITSTTWPWLAGPFSSSSSTWRKRISR